MHVDGHDEDTPEGLCSTAQGYPTKEGYPGKEPKQSIEPWRGSAASDSSAQPLQGCPIHNTVYPGLPGRRATLGCAAKRLQRNKIKGTAAHMRAVVL